MTAPTSKTTSQPPGYTTLWGTTKVESWRPSMWHPIAECASCKSRLARQKILMCLTSTRLKRELWDELVWISLGQLGCMRAPRATLS